MKYTPRIEKAVQTAAELHRDQRRKSNRDLPYVSHLVSVAFILSEYSEDEDVLIAGLLHDTLEDTEYTKEDLERDFGKRVASIVLEVTEDNIRDGKVVPWKERKDGYLENLKHASEEALLVSVADKLHNLRSIIENHREFGAEFINKLSTGKEQQVWFNEEMLKILKERMTHELIESYSGTLTEAKETAFK